jgi:hypothetical protein
VRTYIVFEIEWSLSKKGIREEPKKNLNLFSRLSSHCLARVKGQGHIGLENLEIAGLESGSKPKGGRRSILQWIPHQAKTSVGATRVSVSDRRTPLRVLVRPLANERWITHRARRSAWARAGLRGN